MRSTLAYRRSRRSIGSPSLDLDPVAESTRKSGSIARGKRGRGAAEPPPSQRQREAHRVRLVGRQGVGNLPVDQGGELAFPDLEGRKQKWTTVDDPSATIALLGQQQTDRDLAIFGLNLTLPQSPKVFRRRAGASAG